MIAAVCDSDSRHNRPAIGSLSTKAGPNPEQTLLISPICSRALSSSLGSSCSADQTNLVEKFDTIDLMTAPSHLTKELNHVHLEPNKVYI